MRQTIDPAERLLNLVIALVNTTGRMTREQIRTSVAGYDAAASNDAFERMFERDKDLLRELGVPVVTVDDTGHPDDIGYRVDMDAYALDPVEFSAAEFAVLGLAAEFWQDKSLQLETSRALTKLRAASGHEFDADAASILAPRMREAGDAYGPLFDAILSRRVVTFTYRAATTGQTALRTVEPWRIAARRGGWYLLGRDQDRGASRVFRLTRVEGKVRAIGPENAFEIPADIDVDAHLVGPPAAARTAFLAITRERAGVLRARGTPSIPEELRTQLGDEPEPNTLEGRDLVALEVTNVDRAAREIAGYGDVVVVLGPTELREAVVKHLRAAADLARTVPTEPIEETHNG